MAAVDPCPSSQPRCTLVTGPASSGKSLWAETLAQRASGAVLYLATGPELPDDPDWQERLRRHRQRRPAQWDCQEVGLQLARAVAQAPASKTVLIDSLGTWVAAGLDVDEGRWSLLCQELLEVMAAARASLIAVAEETAWGVVPSTAAGGLFRQRLGNLLQALMPHCDAAWLVLHGRAIDLLAMSISIAAEGLEQR